MEIKKVCDFSDVFDDCAIIPSSLSGIPQPRKKVGHYRADYDGRQWWTTYFPANQELITELLKQECLKVMMELQERFPDLETLRRFCWDGNAVKVSDTEYSCYINEIYGNYWIRLITRNHDYNIYCNIFRK